MISFFFNIFMKNLCCNAIIWTKNVNSVKISILYGPKKSKRCHFFLILHEKLLLSCPYFKNKKVNYCLKSTLLSSHILSQKLSSLKNTLLPWYIFSNNSWKPNTVMPKSGQQERQFVKTTQSYGPRKLIGCFVFRLFTKKPFFSCPFFVKKTSIL